MKTEASPNLDTKELNQTTCILDVTTCIKNPESEFMIDQSKHVNEDNHT